MPALSEKQFSSLMDKLKSLEASMASVNIKFDQLTEGNRTLTEEHMELKSIICGEDNKIKFL